MCGTCCCDGWRLPHPPGQHWGFLVRTIRSHTATNLFRLLTLLCIALSICNWRCYPTFFAQKLGWFGSRLEIVKIANKEFYGKEHSQICFKAESQVKPKAENVLRFYHFLQHHWLILLGSSDCQAVAKMALALRRDRGGLQHMLLLLVAQISKSWWCCCCWIWLHTIA